MRKKLNIFALALLIFGQTILGPIATVSASGIEAAAGESAAVEEKVQDVSEAETRSTDPVEPTETAKPAEPEKPADPKPEVTEPAETPGQDGEAGSEESPGKETDKGEGDSGKSTDSADTPESSDEEDGEGAVVEEEEAEEEERTTFATGDLLDASVMNITNLEIGRKDGASTTGSNGKFPLNITTGNFSDTYYIKFNFSLGAGHGVKPGDYYTFKVPAAFALTQETDKALGSDGLATYSVNPNGEITISFTDAIQSGGAGVPIGNGEFDAGWALAQNAKEGALVKEYPFDISGPKEFILTVANPGGEPIVKRSLGSLPVGDNPTTVKWQVDVNTNTLEIGALPLTDLLTVVPGSIEVIELKPQINGNPIEGTDTGGYTLTNGNSFPITFDNSKKAYRITYETAITDDQREAAIKSGTQIANTATLGTTISNEARQSVTFDAPISKTAGDYTQSNRGRGEIEWTIKVNADGRDISNGVTVKDTLTLTGDPSKDLEKMKIDPNTISISPSPSHQSDTINDNDFEIYFEPAVGQETDEYTITYTTYDTVVDKDYKVSNKAELWYGSATGSAAYDTTKTPTNVDIKHTMLTKRDIGATSSDIDYENKKIKWTINFNESNYDDITNVVFDDTFQAGKYMKLYATDFSVPTGFTLDLKAPQTDAGGTYTLTGFTLTSNATTVSAPVTITYTTHFDPKDPTTKTSIENTVNVDWTKDTVDYANNDRGEVTLNSHTGNNGAKSGTYNPEHKTIAWTLDVNYNLHSLTTPVIEDIFGNKQTMTQAQLGDIKVYTLNMTATPSIKNLVTSGYSVVGTGETADGFTGFTLTFANDTPEAYRIVYDTGYVNKFIGELDGTNSKKAKNTAILKSDGKHHTTFDTENLSGSPTVRNAGEYFTKSGRDIAQTDYLEWKFAFNNSQSHIQTGSTIHDVLNDGQVLVEDFTGLTLADITTPRDAFEIKKRVYTGTSHIQQKLTAAEVDALFNIAIATDKKSFTITLKQDINHEYEISYVTDISASKLTTLTNTYTYDFNGKTKEDTKTQEVKNVTYQYSGGNANLPRYNLKLTKTDGYTNLPLENVKFGLYLGNSLVEEGTTDSSGVLNFNQIRYGKYILKELEPSDDTYSKEFQVAGESIFSDEYEYQTTGTTENLEIKMINKKTCPVFTLTVKYDGNPVQAGVNVVIKDKTGTTEVATGKTNANGQIEFDKDDLPKGEYKVYDTKDVELGDINVLYLQGDCAAEVTWAAGADMSCPVFTLTVKENGTAVSENMKITLQDATDATKAPVTAYTNAQGKIEYNKTTLPAGTYDVFNNKNEKIGTVEVESLVVCEDEIDLATGSIKACPVFTLTVNDRSNNPRAGVEITVKGAGGVEVEGVDVNGDPITTFITDANGQVEFPYVIEPGTYTVYEVVNGNEKRMNTFTVTTDCEAEVKPRPATGGGGGTTPPQTCDAFTVTVKQHNVVVGADVELTLKSGSTEVATGKTDATGKIVFDKADLPAGSYTAYDKEGNDVGTITVSYDEGECQAVVNITTNTCDVFTVTVKENGQPVGEDVALTVKDKDGKEVTTGKTDKDGKIVFEEDQLPAGEYTVYDEEDNEVGTITVSYDGNCEDEVNLTPNTCDVFTVTVKENGKPVGEDVALTVKDKDGKTVTTGKTDKDGKIVFEEDKLPAGKYTVYDEEDNEVGTINVSYKADCEDEVNLTPNTCDVFTVTVKENGKPVEAHTALILKDAAGKNVAAGSTDADGKVTFDKVNLPAGSYTAYDKDENELGTVIVSYELGDCEAVVDSQPQTQACDAFTITVKQSGKVVGADTSLTLKDDAGKTVATGKTDKDGKIVFDKADLPEGSYKAYDGDDKEVGTVIVSYNKDECQAVVDLQVKACETFTLTVTDKPNADVSLKDANGETVVEGKTDADEKVIFTKPIPEGTYTVFVDGEEIGKIVVTDTCTGNIAGSPSNPDPGPGSGGGGGGSCGIACSGGGTPVDPPTGPTDPDKPVGPPTGPTDPDKPVGPPTGPTDPDKPVGPPTGPTDPDKPVDPPTGPTDPNKPGIGTDTDEKPGTGIGTETDKKSENKLPQTGEAFPVGPMAGGFAAIALGMWLLLRRTKVRQTP